MTKHVTRLPFCDGWRHVFDYDHCKGKKWNTKMSMAF